MRVIGRHRVAKFLQGASKRNEADAVRAWLYEIECRRWDSPDALVKDFVDAAFDSAPRLVFRLAGGAVRIEAVADFRVGVVIITVVKATKAGRKARPDEEAA